MEISAGWTDSKSRNVPNPDPFLKVYHRLKQTRKPSVQIESHDFPERQDSKSSYKSDTHLEVEYSHNCVKVAGQI